MSLFSEAFDFIADFIDSGCTYVMMICTMSWRNYSMTSFESSIEATAIRIRETGDWLIELYSVQ